MKHSLLILLQIIFGCLIVSGCQKDDPIDDGPNDRQLITLTRGQEICKDNSNEFSFQLLEKIESSHKGKSYFFSPMSVEFALGLLGEGVDGKTRGQILEALGIENMDDFNSFASSMLKTLPSLDKKTKVVLSNLALSNSSLGIEFKKDYTNSVERIFDATVKSMDFSSKKTVSFVNDWGSKNTEGKIKNIGDYLSASQDLFLANAIYFKGSWCIDYFNKAKTKKGEFTKEDGRKVKRDMMECTGGLAYGVYDKHVVGSLSYGNSSFVMTICLPLPGYTVSDIISDVPDGLSGKVKPLVNGPVDTFKMPKFQGNYRLNLAGPLTSLGITELFNKGNTDFGGMTNHTPCYISGLMQDSFISIDENGTEAAAITIVANGMVANLNFNDFIVDRPFLYVIREISTGTILFMGKYAGE